MLPRTRKQKHRFCTPAGYHTHEGNIVTIQTSTFKANNLKDPADQLPTGILTNGAVTAIDVHDPLLSAQLAQMYDSYVVTAAHIRVDFHNSEPSSLGQNPPLAFRVGVALKDDVTPFTTLGQYVENGEAAYTILGVEGVGSVTLDVDVADFFGSTAPQSDSQLRVTSFGTAPGQTLFFHIFSEPLQNVGSGTPGENYVIHFSVYCEYDVTWMEPKDITRSS